MPLAPPDTPKPKAYSYLRFSTLEQEAGDSTRRQTSLAADYAARKGLQLDDQLNLKDRGVSAFHGANATEGRLAAFLEAVQSGEVPRGSVLLVESLDRISRDTAFQAQTLLSSIIMQGIASVAGLLEEGRISRARPFRAPHHSASMAALTGGGLRVRPGEVSLAHLGVLFLDELPEFQRAVLDSLRQPLETGEVTVARANAHVTFPARVQLVAAMNPCRCGHMGDPALGCSRAPRCGADYQSRVSGPLLDRIDLHVEVDPVAAADLAMPPPREGSAEVGARVARARHIQTARLEPLGLRTNAELEGEALERHATPDEPGRQLLMQAADALRLSARGYTRILRVARTIADLAGAEVIGRIHLAEALSYRRQSPRA